jgi:hypothetical protein
MKLYRVLIAQSSLDARGWMWEHPGHSIDVAITRASQLQGLPLDSIVTYTDEAPRNPEWVAIIESLRARGAQVPADAVA